MISVEGTWYADTEHSASPLNGEAAILWDKDQVDFKKKVLARHQKPEDVEDNA